MAGSERKQDGLDVLLPERLVELGGGDVVTVKPLMFMQLPQGARHLDAIIRGALEADMVSERGEIDVSRLAGLIGAVGEHINELILLCTHIDGQPIDREWLGKVTLEEGMDLAAAVVEVNWRDTIVKKLESLATRVTSRLEMAGSSSPSS
jgi:hypothetical protein